MSRSGPPPTKRAKLQHTGLRDTGYDNTIAERSPSSNGVTEPRPKSILKKAKAPAPKTSAAPARRETTPPVELSRAVKDKLAEDDEEIAALEKKLGLKGKKKLPQSFTEDGLDDLLEGLDDEDPDIQESKKRKAEGDEWLEQKRAQARKLAKISAGTEAESEESDDQSSAEDIFDLSDSDATSGMSLDDRDPIDDESVASETGEQDDELVGDEDFDGFDPDEDSLDEAEVSQPVKRVRENPYVAPAVATVTGKYIPPSLRQAVSSGTEDLTRLRRRIQGLVNRLTEANLISILGDVEKLYRDNPRQHVTSTLVDVLLTSVCEPTSLPDTLIMLPAGFIAAIYKVIGTDFGAQVIQRIVELFDEHYTQATHIQDISSTTSTETTKETSNIIMILSELYNFQVVGSNLMFDYIKLFLEKLSELNAELLLKIIRTSGPQLRQDDPSSLKDIVAMLRPAVEAVGESNISVRTKFMIETINNLKNNRMKTGAVASAVTSEHTIQMKKILGSLNNRNVKASEPLRIGLNDIRASDKKGKWWLVGASWAGNTTEETDDDDVANVRDVKKASTRIAEDTGTSDLLQLAKEQRMNTDIRRAIFVSIMSAQDYQDAYMRLMKLKLKKVQEYEIPKVLVHCAAGEQSYNPYYTLIAKKVCGDRRLRTAFQFCLWDLFKRMGESDEEDEVPDDDAEALDNRQLVNLAKMFGTLILDGGLSLGVLKNLNLSYLQPKTKTFLEVLFISILLQSQKAKSGRDEQAVANIFSKAKDTPQLIRSLQYFMKKVVAKTDIAGGKDEKAIVKWACKVAVDTLDALAAIDT